MAVGPHHGSDDLRRHVGLAPAELVCAFRLGVGIVDIERDKVAFEVVDENGQEPGLAIVRQN